LRHSGYPDEGYSPLDCGYWGNPRRAYDIAPFTQRPYLTSKWEGTPSDLFCHAPYRVAGVSEVPIEPRPHEQHIAGLVGDNGAIQSATTQEEIAIKAVRKTGILTSAAEVGEPGSPARRGVPLLHDGEECVFVTIEGGRPGDHEAFAPARYEPIGPGAADH